MPMMNDDVCDTCMRSGVEISHVDANGNTVCVECRDEDEDDERQAEPLVDYDLMCKDGDL